jgi:hypothetical protein
MWVASRLGMARSTAYEKVQVAGELRRRPWLADALESGRVSYSAVRAICRIDAVDAELDESLLVVAESHDVAAVERAVRHWRLCHDQDRPPDPERVGVRTMSGYGGALARLVVDAPEVVVEEVRRAIGAFVTDDEGASLRTWGERHVDGLADACRVALAHAKDGGAVGEDRYLVHVVTDIARFCGGEGRAELLGGGVLDEATLDTILCDCSYVDHFVGIGLEPLGLGRKTRQWNTAQRRAITVRDGGRCRMVGCENRRVDIHHLHDWDLGGPTDVTNGGCLCRAHHTLIHQRKLLVSGDANGTLLFSRADGTPIGFSKPPPDSSRLFP